MRQLLDHDRYVNEHFRHLLARTRRGVTATYAPVPLWAHFDRKREMAAALDRMLRETTGRSFRTGGRSESAQQVATCQ